MCVCFALHSWKVLSFFSAHRHLKRKNALDYRYWTKSSGSWWLSHSHSFPYFVIRCISFPHFIHLCLYIVIITSRSVVLVCPLCLLSVWWSTITVLVSRLLTQLRLDAWERTGMITLKDKLLLLFLVLDEKLLSQRSVAVCKYLCNKSHCLKAKALNNHSTTDTFIKPPNIS